MIKAKETHSPGTGWVKHTGLMHFVLGNRNTCIYFSHLLFILSFMSEHSLMDMFTHKKSETCLGMESAPYMRDAILEEDQHQPNREYPQSPATEIKHTPRRKASRKCERPARTEPPKKNLSSRSWRRRKSGRLGSWQLLQVKDVCLLYMPNGIIP